LNVKAYDKAGNTATASVSITVDVTAPVSNATGVQNGSSLGADLSGNVTETNVDTYLWTLVTGVGTATFGSDNTEDTTVVVSAYGAYTFRLTVTDKSANVTTSDVNLTFNPPAPVAPANSVTITNFVSQTGTTGNANANGNTNGGPATTGDVTNTNDTTVNAVLGATDGPKTPAASTAVLGEAVATGNKNLLKKWYTWALLVLALFFLLLAGKRRKNKDED
jgi:hypothetical protein